MEQKARVIAKPYCDVCAQGAALYQMSLPTGDLLMGYLIRTASGKLFCIGGGCKEATGDFLTLARRVSGCEDGDVLHIDGWFLTHPHHDHIEVLLQTVLNYSGQVKIDKLWYNFPSTAYQDQYEPQFAFASHNFDAVRGLIAPFAEVVHPGMTFDFGDVRFDVLTEPDESVTVNTGNNSCVAIRMTLEGQTALFLADMGIEQGERFLQAYPAEKLRADFVQMAHHGQDGVDYSVYSAIAPKACLWSTARWLWTKNAGGGYGTGPFKTFGVRCFMEDLGVKHHFVQKDGVWEIPLPYAFE